MPAVRERIPPDKVAPNFTSFIHASAFVGPGDDVAPATTC